MMNNCNQHSMNALFHSGHAVRTGAKEGLLSYQALFSTPLDPSDSVKVQVTKAIESALQPDPSQLESNCGGSISITNDRILMAAGWIFLHDKRRAGYYTEVISGDFVCKTNEENRPIFTATSVDGEGRLLDLGNYMTWNEGQEACDWSFGALAKLLGECSPSIHPQCAT
jgi:hypothetical protein